MAHGSREQRIRAMTDRTTGAGALALGMITMLVTFAALASLPVWMIAVTVLSAEVFGKMVMGLFSALGRPFHAGIQQYIYDVSKRRFAVYTVLLTLPLFLLPLRQVMGAGFLAAVLVFLGLLTAAGRLFGGVNGDVTGAGNELTRMAVCLAAAFLASA
jgi:adenosylcobinamide-GDP ribazoletransferase